ncbi:MAG TPA: hypothetical protein ENH06_01235 [bacterium]|nr:hypothetical protein [bacterium]
MKKLKEGDFNLRRIDIFKLTIKKELQDKNNIKISTIINKLISRSDATKNSDGSYSFTEGIDLSNLGLTSFPIRFKDVKGSFYCDRNKLASLKGAPQTVAEDFDCSGNKLTSLKGAPQIVRRNFYCYGNNLISLKGIPQIVEGDFYYYNNIIQFTEEDIKVVCDVKGIIHR